MQNPFQEYTPESRAWTLAQESASLTDEELLAQTGYVPHDGTLLRDDLVTLYREESTAAAERFNDGLKSHAMDWAFNLMRSDYETAHAYGNHIVEQHRAGELTVESSHKGDYPLFLAASEAERQADEPELGA